MTSLVLEQDWDKSVELEVLSSNSKPWLALNALCYDWCSDSLTAFDRTYTPSGVVVFVCVTSVGNLG